MDAPMGAPVAHEQMTAADISRDDLEGETIPAEAFYIWSICCHDLRSTPFEQSLLIHPACNACEPNYSFCL